MSNKTIDLQEVIEITNTVIEENKIDESSSKIVQASVIAVMKILDSKSIIHYTE